MDVSSQQHPFLLGIRFRNTKSNFDLIQIQTNATSELNTAHLSKLSLLDIQRIISPSTSPSDMQVGMHLAMTTSQMLQPSHPHENAHQTHFISKSHTVDEYAIYTMIENHMNISSSLYRLNKEGQDILREIGTKKMKLTPLAIIGSRAKKPVVMHCVPTDVLSLYMSLVDIVNFNRTSADAYTELVSMLDDAMFSESHDMDTFYVDETEYSLESLYYKQETWVSELEWHKKEAFSFSNQPSFDLGECSHILMFLNDYQDILKKISEEMESCEKVIAHTSKISVKITSIHNAMYALLHKHLDDQ
jgi:hypothetical protein